MAGPIADNSSCNDRGKSAGTVGAIAVTKPSTAAMFVCRFGV